MGLSYILQIFVFGKDKVLDNWQLMKSPLALKEK